VNAVPELVLYNYWRSSSSHRVRIALALKGLAYRYVAVNLLRGEHSAEAHSARSPTGRVPCLSVDGVNYVESVAIVEFLDECFPQPPLYPADPHHRARVRTLVEIVNSGTQPLHNSGVLVYRSPDSAEQRAWAAHFIEKGLSSFERAMDNAAREGLGGRFACGDTPTAADVFLVPQVYAAARFGVDSSAFPRLHAAFVAAGELDAVRQAAPERQPDSPGHRSV
jgi:maleylacetoacetate isomerase